MTTPATYGTPAGWADRCTLRDDTAAHQIRIEIGNTHRLRATCICDRFSAVILTAEQALDLWRKHHQEMTA